MTAHEDDFIDPEPFIRYGRRAGPALRTPRAISAGPNPHSRAARRVHRPAIALLLMAVLSALEGLFIALVSHRSMHDNTNWLWIGVCLILWFAGVAYGAFEMDRLGAYRVAQVAGWMGLVPIPLPTYPLTLAASLAVLVRLSDTATKNEFRTFQR
jgi:hypothetical protein